MPFLPPWILQVGVEVPGHQKLLPAGVLADVRDNAFYGNRVVGGQVKSENKPEQSSLSHLEAHHVWPVQL